MTGLALPALVELELAEPELAAPELLALEPLERVVTAPVEADPELAVVLATLCLASAGS